MARTFPTPVRSTSASPRGRHVPFLNYQKGIYRAAAQRGPAVPSVNPSFKSPCNDVETPDGFL
jgi:hypothetical protein